MLVVTHIQPFQYARLVSPLPHLCRSIQDPQWHQRKYTDKLSLVAKKFTSRFPRTRDTSTNIEWLMFARLFMPAVIWEKSNLLLFLFVFLFSPFLILISFLCFQKIDYIFIYFLAG